jgi:tRNA (adenine22-N1)-methyltransferase
MGNFTKKLSNRLQLIYDQLQPGQEVWDLCCDHGYLGLKAHSSQNFSHIHFVDPAVHLIEVLKRICHGVEGISFYGVPAQEVQTTMRGNVVAAGVGAELICTIIFNLLATAKLEAERLILVPHKHPDKMKTWLLGNKEFTRKYSLQSIQSVEENGRLREVFIFQRS